MASFEDFVVSIKPYKVESVHQNIFDLFQSVDSVQIFTKGAILDFLNAIVNAYKDNRFKSKDTVLLLLDQFDAMIKQMKEWCTEGVKGGEGKCSIYYSPENIDLNVMLSSSDEGPDFLMTGVLDGQLILTDDEMLKTRAQERITVLKQQKMCLCGVGDKGREKIYSYFHKRISTDRNKLQ